MSDLKFLTTITCSCCGKTHAGHKMQPKQLAKKLCWKHGKAKGVWLCPECQRFVSSQPK